MNNDLENNEIEFLSSTISKEYYQIEKLLFQIQNKEFDNNKNRALCISKIFQFYNKFIIAKKIAHKGIPNLLRGFIWYEWVEAEKYRKNSTMEYGV